MRKDFIDGLYTDTPDDSIPTDESGAWRVAVFTEPCRTSAALEARAKLYEQEAADGKHEIPFLGSDGLPELILTEAERDALKEFFTDEQIAGVLK
jgi:hypothetical protein